MRIFEDLNTFIVKTDRWRDYLKKKPVKSGFYGHIILFKSFLGLNCFVTILFLRNSVLIFRSIITFTFIGSQFWNICVNLIFTGALF